MRQCKITLKMSPALYQEEEELYIDEPTKTACILFVSLLNTEDI
jgi:hypothetical protein